MQRAMLLEKLQDELTTAANPRDRMADKEEDQSDTNERVAMTSNNVNRHSYGIFNPLSLISGLSNLWDHQENVKADDVTTTGQQNLRSDNIGDGDDDGGDDGDTIDNMNDYEGRRPSTRFAPYDDPLCARISTCRACASTRGCGWCSSSRFVMLITHSSTPTYIQ
jgi:hypothetical protein